MLPLNDNLILATDSYKLSHAPQYPPQTERVYSYFESRVGAEFPETVFFGLQYFLAQYLARPITRAQINEAEDVVRLHLGSDAVFNRKGWEHIVSNYDGRLPVRIKAVPEGMVLPIQNALVTVENLDSMCWWLTNYLETLISEIWYPITVATQSRAIKKIILAALDRTGTPETIGFKLHDFGFRGVSSPESAAIGGLAHLVNFFGTDTLAAIQLGRRCYDEPCAGYSIPASEHSTITSWGKDEETIAYWNMIKQYGDQPLYACVSDSWDIMNACDIWGTILKKRVLAAKGTLVVRPDSGDPAHIVLAVIKRLMKHFGYRTNEKGFDVLNDKVRVIQGDGVNIDSIGLVLRTLESNGISADNVAFGMGGALLQKLNRDTMNFAFKCSAVRIGSATWRDVYKQPASDPKKNSKKGKFDVVDGEHGHVITVPEGTWTAGPQYLRTVYEFGEIKKSYTLAEIRARVTR